ncbi:MAG TPA: tRNA (adenosine(37)-N6)-threonylcarbamoyltransferase complex dimerization subunit type 1 TsaB [Alphaproteobacteria bacterium]|nr:tRNA (adenosine(37)-N6)-threonylcarbamoyltransferase complex dimerization subunit type 1 TsaB [Alphaproteobacteria bacterium]
MKVLAFDCSGAACSAALWEDGTTGAHRFERRERGHAERLLPMLREILSERGATFSDVDIFAASTGPGAFTGVRVGLATLRGLALAVGRPMLGVTSFEAIAHSTDEGERAGRDLLVVIESKRADLFAQTFSPSLLQEGAPQALPPDRLVEQILATNSRNALLVAGDGAGRITPLLRKTGRDAVEARAAAFPDASAIARLAATWRARASHRPPAPIYLRAPAVTLQHPARG